MSLEMDSTNTKKAMTIKNKPLMNPERTSTRPNLENKKTSATHYYCHIVCFKYRAVIFMTENG